MVRKWWRTLKGIPFLPANLLRRLPGLARPSIPRSHAAYQKCQEFLDYLHDTWVRGRFRSLWCKWGLTELRTTNLAEAYHSKLRRIIRKKNVNLQLILERIRKENTTAIAKLISLDQFPNEGRRLRRRDRLRRQKFAAKMAEFERELSRGGIVTTVSIIRYCRHMARFMTEKAI
ncbi:hypothetical protein Y032_0009g654 [Ancylostoma ceylanicum]|uniref:Uncharacterized protein n=1 Tax=Ancylostoma ceylanicum TaxID=53326 RepID=A0A016VJ51_9BILA|nr:hypothetical protein Y032_0009g654 [Ancylostoma ceylanicum]